MDTDNRRNAEVTRYTRGRGGAYHWSYNITSTTVSMRYDVMWDVGHRFACTASQRLTTICHCDLYSRWVRGPRRQRNPLWHAFVLSMKEISNQLKTTRGFVFCKLTVIIKITTVTPFLCLISRCRTNCCLPTIHACISSFHSRY